MASAEDTDRHSVHQKTTTRCLPPTVLVPSRLLHPTFLPWLIGKGAKDERGVHYYCSCPTDSCGE